MDIWGFYCIYWCSFEESSLPHPYEYEIQNIEYPAHMFEARPEQLYAPMEQTPFTWVDTEEKLRELARLLESATEIAVDTEVGTDWSVFDEVFLILTRNF